MRPNEQLWPTMHRVHAQQFAIFGWDVAKELEDALRIQIVMCFGQMLSNIRYVVQHVLKVIAERLQFVRFWFGSKLLVDNAHDANFLHKSYKLQFIVEMEE